MHYFILAKDKCPKKSGLMIFPCFPDRSVNYTMTPTGTRELLKLLTWNFHQWYFKSIGHIVWILRIGLYFTQITHFLDNRWSVRLEILHVVSDYQYLTLVRISSRYHFPIPRYKILGLIWAKRVIWGRSVKYTHMTGGKKLTPRPKILPYRKSTYKI